VSVGTLKYFLDLPRIREKKRRKTNFPEVWPLFGTFCTKSAKICPAALLLFGPFWVKWPNIWPVGSTDTALSTEQYRNPPHPLYIYHLYCLKGWAWNSCT
jgi:hypothetical protein